MSYEKSKSFTEEQKDYRIIVKRIIALQENKGWPIKPYLKACVNFDADFIESYDEKVRQENKGACIWTQTFWENIRSNVEQHTFWENIRSNVEQHTNQGKSC